MDASERSRELPSLPNELWHRITTAACHDKSNSWHAWAYLRPVSHVFKNAVEVYYRDRYLKRTFIDVDGGWDWTEEDGKVLINGHFNFSHLEDESGEEKHAGLGEVAVFKIPKEEIAKGFRGAVENAVRNAMVETWDGFGSSSQIIVMVRRYLTDLLPMDLAFMRKGDEFMLKFNWRTWYCTFWDEFRAENELCLNTDESETGKTRAELEAYQEEHGPNAIPPDYFDKLFSKMAERGRERTRLVRRQRRLRFAERQKAKGKEGFRTWEGFEKHGEAAAIARQKSYSWNTWLAEFSDDDEEEEEGDEGREEDGDDGDDEEDEWDSEKEGMSRAELMSHFTLVSEDDDGGDYENEEEWDSEAEGMSREELMSHFHPVPEEEIGEEA